MEDLRGKITMSPDPKVFHRFSSKLVRILLLVRESHKRNIMSPFQNSQNTTRFWKIRFFTLRQMENFTKSSISLKISWNFIFLRWQTKLVLYFYIKNRDVTAHRFLEIVIFPFKDTGTKFEPHFSFVMLNYFRTNKYEEPWLLVAWSWTLKYEYWIEVNYDWRRTPLH